MDGAVINIYRVFVYMLSVCLFVLKGGGRVPARPKSVPAPSNWWLSSLVLAMAHLAVLRLEHGEPDGVSKHHWVHVVQPSATTNKAGSTVPRRPALDKDSRPLLG